MNKIIFFALLTSLSCLFSSFLKGQDRLADYYPPTPVPDRILLNLTDHPSTSVAVTWRTSLSVKRGFVQIAKAEASPEFVDAKQVVEASSRPYLSDRSGANYHSAILSNLQPDTEYAYRVGDSLHWSEWAHFRTASSGKKELSFLYFGDAQNDLKSMWSRVIRGAYSKMPEVDFLLHAGDLVNRANSDHEWGEWYYAAGWINLMIPSISTPGNHEYYRAEDGGRGLSKQWRPTFTLPENGPKGLEETVFYLDYEHVRIISLNSPAFLASEEARVAQLKWLEPLLTDNPQKWTIITMHHPIYSSKFGRENKELQAELQPLFEKYKVDLVLQGHDHTYSRGTNMAVGEGKKTIDGPMYVVSVSGPKMYDLGMEDWVQRAASNTQLYQLITVKNDVLRFEAYMVTGELYDAFELQKSKNGKSVFTDYEPKVPEERLELPKSYRERYKQQDWDEFNKRFDAYKARKAQKN